MFTVAHHHSCYLTLPECPAQPESRGRSPGPGPGVNLQKEASHQERSLQSVDVLDHQRKQPRGQDPGQHPRKAEKNVVVLSPRRGVDPGKGSLQRRRE